MEFNNRDQAKEYIKPQLENYLKQKGIDTKKPFKCLNPTHADKNPSMSYDGKRNKAHCFSCGADYDTLDLIGLDYNLSDSKEQFKKAYEIYHIIIKGKANKKEFIEFSETIKKEDKTMQNTQVQDYTAFYNEAHSHIGDTDYPAIRGLSKETIDRFNIGYIAEWKHPNPNPDKPQPPPSPRFIIPTGRHSYAARDIRESVDKNFRYIKVGEAEIFNGQALDNAQRPIFITEGEIDALSIIEAGGEAAGLGSTQNTHKLLDLIQDHKPIQPLIIALDNDEAGEAAAGKLIEGLKTLNIAFYKYNPYGDHKDANEALTADREAFILEIQKAQQEAGDLKDAERKEYLKNSTANYIDAFTNGINESINTPCIPTGFNKLDIALDGGLYEGLYVIGAISSLGKTTFITQAADQIAKAGNDVLIFSMEMARAELMAKSISRETFQLTLPKGETWKAKTARGITAGKRYQEYKQEEKETIYKAIREYAAYAKNIFIIEGAGEVGAKQIRETVEKHISITGKRPVVIIDYLQILSPYNERYTDKQNMDKVVLELKRISRDHKLPVIAISSFNRMSYKGEVKEEAFKESGAIEYSSDILIGLQAKGADKDINITEEKKKNPRDIELVILKNRNGAAGITLLYSYNTLFNHFSEIVPY
jgi:replicative DNA helicase